MANQSSLENLRALIHGDFYLDDVSCNMYATDASAYYEKPLAVACPKDVSDIHVLIEFAREHHISLIPRAGGTSLAGQVVGNGIVVDISKYMTRILDLNLEDKWVWVEPGVILDELNRFLYPYGYFFAPETSTSNRCTIGGMVSNNSCGSHSLIYGSTRDHTLSVKALLSDGSESEFSALDKNELLLKCEGNLLENKIYKKIVDILSYPDKQSEIKKQYPKRSIRRRNNGYALDSLLDTIPYGGQYPFNLCTLIAGAEGTLVFITAIKLRIVPLPPPVKALLCVHLHSVEDALHANLIALKHKPDAVELMDHIILECTKNNILQLQNRFFVKENPGAILIVEFSDHTRDDVLDKINSLEEELKEKGMGYHYPVVTGNDINKVWALRKAGLGVLSNLKGDAKPVSVIEDTAISPEDLPAYIAELKVILAKYNLDCVYHAHIATGELHLRPVLNLKDPGDIVLFRTIAREVALLVKKYKGSLSGEHGDGRLRGEFIPIMYGEAIYQLFKEVKQCFDPQDIFNSKKIVDTPPMDTSLRYMHSKSGQEISTIFDFSSSMGFLRAIEKCNGSGDCRKRHTSGGVMCPSYMATLDERYTTRARANIMREYLLNPTGEKTFDSHEIYEILDFCLSCKGCKSECPSNIDMAKFKAEFLFHYYKINKIPFHIWMIAHISLLNRLGNVWPEMYNRLTRIPVVKKMMKFDMRSVIPHIFGYTLRSWIQRNQFHLKYSVNQSNGKLYLFIDEFVNYYDVPIGIKSILLLHKLGYQIEIVSHKESGRAYISKGLLNKARRIADRNINIFSSLVTQETPLVGIEPSGILSFKDEYPELASVGLRDRAQKLASSTYTIEEFIVREFRKGRIMQDRFTDKNARIVFHGHCQQKSLITTISTYEMLSIPRNYSVSELKTGCCGMAGSFGYEKNHYELSVKIGELSLFPQVRDCESGTMITAPGTSCRQHIKNNTGKHVFHPVEVLYDAIL